MFSFTEEFNKLLEVQLANWPQDKKDHFLASKALFITSWPESNSTSMIAIESMLESLFTGLIKEFNDRNADSSKFILLFEEFMKTFRLIDREITKNQLDETDIIPDTCGVLSSALLNLMPLVEKKTP